jgi:AcrR family transcriptional regulator
VAKVRAKAVYSRNGVRPRRAVDVGAIRREEIIDAAAATIAEQGIQNLSLSEIEARTGMSRGQLTYYFPEKEQILLAVFDRTVSRMRERVAEPKLIDPYDHMALVVDMIMFRPMMPEFVALQYTFLAQTGHRADFRQRLAKLYGHWRSILMDELDTRPGHRQPIAARTRASLFQAVAHGLAVQLVADPKAFDRAEMMNLCQQLFAIVANGKPRRKLAKSNTKGRRRD